jgi:hypothetical protein
MSNQYLLTPSVITSINKSTVSFNHPVIIDFVIFVCITTDAENQFTPKECREACAIVTIPFCPKGPNTKEENHAAERTWHSLHKFADTIFLFIPDFLPTLPLTPSV